MKLKDISFSEFLYLRLKKVILDFTSVKVWTMTYVCVGIYDGKISAALGLTYLAACLGLKEFIDFKDKIKETLSHVSVPPGQETGDAEDGFFKKENKP